MDKKIKLTEADVQKIIDLSVRRIIKENAEDEWGNIFTQDGRNQWKNFGNSAKNAIQTGRASFTGNYQGNRDKTELYGANANIDAAKRLEDIDNACRRLRNEYVSLMQQRNELEAYCKRKGLATIDRSAFKKNTYSPHGKAISNFNNFGGRNYSSEQGGF